MTLTANVYVEGRDLALVPTIRSCPEADIGVVPDVGTDPQQDVYFFWVEAAEFDAVEAALTSDHTVGDFTRILETDDRRTYRVRYSDDAELFSPAVTEHDGVVIESHSESEGWLLRVQLQDHEDLYRLRERARERNLRFELREVSQGDRSEDRSDTGLTTQQARALVTAYEHGYYSEPRETDLKELGDELGISPTAVSSLLRRASERLIEESLGYEKRDQDP